MLKSSHKSRKLSKEPSMRKTHLSKKLHSRSPVRRPAVMKHMSPGLRRGPPLLKRKASHSPRLRSIASSPHRSLSHRSKQESPESMERIHNMKGLKYDKRSQLSISPVRSIGPSSSRRPTLPSEARGMPPYATERYASSSAAVHPPQYGSPTRKKTQREPDHYFTSRSISASPPRRHVEVPLHPESHVSHRPGNASPVLHHRHRRMVPAGHVDMRNKHHPSSSVVPSTHSKESSVKIPYPNDGRYRSASPTERYSSGGQKSYGPTLHERFSNVIESSREPRVRYSREDLEKITIDIRRNLKEPSPTLRQIVNPSDVKLVRRANEGHRPIFDREEIKQAPRDLREDAYFERKTTTGSYNAVHAINLREVENYQITRHRFDNQHDIFSSSSGRTLNDRWQNPEARKNTVNLDRDEREKEYERIPVSRSYVPARSRSHSGDQDFRSERYLDAKLTQSRSNYPSRPPVEASESRSIPYPHRKSSVPLDARHKLNVRKGDRDGHPSAIRSESKGSFHPHSDRHFAQNVPSSRVERREHHSPIPEPHKWSYKSRSSSRERSDVPRRPDKYGFKSWIDKPDVTPKGSNYFEHHQHENREGSSSYHLRGNTRPFRSSRGFRTRGFRGPSRGGSFYRGGSFRGYRSTISPRGRGPLRR